MVFQLTKRLAFPDPHWGDPDGLLAIGGDLSVCLLYTSPSPRDRG